MTIDPEHECEASDVAREDLAGLLFDMKRMRPRRPVPATSEEILAMFAAPVTAHYWPEMWEAA